jgi:hypothetical protein
MPSLTPWDKNEKARVHLWLQPDGSPALNLEDTSGKTRAVLGVTGLANQETGVETKTAENTLTLLDAKGNGIWQAPR